MTGGADVTWLACALSDVDRLAAERLAGGQEPAGAHHDIRARFLDVPSDAHRHFYDDACITGLGFIFHGLVDLAYTPTFDVSFRRGWEAYRLVNRIYAEELHRCADGRPVLVEDYHLMLVADELRQLRPVRSGPLSYFHHIPWCQVAHFGMLPAPLRQEILGKLLSYDTIGFHAQKWADAFLDCCDRFLPGARCEAGQVSWRGRDVPLVVAPVQVDPAHLRTVRDGATADAWRKRFRRRLAGRRALVRVDRVDLWKNIGRGFTAFERLVRDCGITDVAFIALLSRSRMHIAEYRRYLAACRAEARRVNRALNPSGNDGPIYLLLANDHSDHGRALAGLAEAGAVLVNAVADGLNLVAKEAVIAAEGESGLVISETTGVHEEIGQWVHGINPLDIQETADSIATALKGNGNPPALLAHVEQNSPARWVESRLAPLR
jgi:trehalose 6-phosphate synthase